MSDGGFEVSVATIAYIKGDMLLPWLRYTLILLVCYVKIYFIYMMYILGL